MKYEMYAVFDKKAGLFSKPMFYVNMDTAMRAVRIAKTQHADYKHCPEDYSLWYLGDWEDTDATFVDIETQHPVCKFIDLPEIETE